MKIPPITRPVLCLGDACPDILLPYGDTRRVLAAVERGEAVDGPQRGAELSPGGSIANTASGLGRLGCPCLFAGRAGRDFYGLYLREAFLRDGVDVSRFHLDPEISTMMVLIVDGEDGERVPYAMPREKGSQNQIRPEDLPDSLLSEIGWVHTSGIMLREDPAASSIADFVERCAGAGVPVSLDVNLRIEAMGQGEDKLRRVADRAAVLFGSGPDELMPLTGKGSPREAALSLVRPGRAVVCRLGAGGSTVYWEGGESHCPAFPVEVVDTVGAGDAFNSGFLAALAAGEDLAEANRWGSGAAALNLTGKGARNCPRREILEKFLRTN